MVRWMFLAVEDLWKSMRLWREVVMGVRLVKLVRAMRSHRGF